MAIDKANLKRLSSVFLILILTIVAAHAVLNLVLTIPSVVITLTAVASSACNGTLVEVGSPPSTTTAPLTSAGPPAPALTTSTAATGPPASRLLTAPTTV